MDDLVLQSVLRIAENLPFLAFTLWLWSQERNARMLAEQREREKHCSS